ETYTGSEIELTGVTVGGADGLVSEHTHNVTYSAKGTEVGGYPGTITATADIKITDADGNDVTTNYTITSVPGKLTITKSDEEFEISLEDDEYKYDGAEHANAKMATSTAATGTTTYSYSFEEAGEYVSDLSSLTKVDADEYTIYVKGTNPNYASEATTTAKLTITKRSVTLTSATDSKVYDGQPLTNDEVTVSGDGFANGEGANYDVTGTQTLVGSSKNTFTYTLNEGTKADNYTITTVNGTLTVTDGTNPDDPKPVDDNLVVTKTVDGKEYKSGETITFTITATNIYAEPRTITLEEIDGVTLEKSTFENVPGGETVETTATHTVTPQDIKEGEGSFKNTVTAKVGALEKKAETEAMIEPAKPHVKLVKTVTSKPEDGKAYLEGETVTYQITVKNDGNVPVEGISVSDELTGDSWQIRILEPGEEQLFDTEYEVTAEDAEARKVTNVVTGKTPDDDVPVDPGTTDVPTAKKYPLTIHYVYTATGAQAAPDYTAELKEGEAYSVTSPAISGYTASRTTVSGSMPKRPHEETVFYTATEPAPVPPTPVTPGTPGGPAVPALTVIEDPETPLGLGNLSLNAGECIE
ncbi:MAG: MucBP domain-containing protein, partial [Clostridia bacterium]|nr:MucBP domain-containing protein [Clostridia bacterium]